MSQTKFNLNARNEIVESLKVVNEGDIWKREYPCEDYCCIYYVQGVISAQMHTFYKVPFVRVNVNLVQSPIQKSGVQDVVLALYPTEDEKITDPTEIAYWLLRFENGK